MTPTSQRAPDQASRSLERDSWLTRPLAAKLIREAGIPAERHTLEFLARKGRGPKFSKIMGRAVYRRVDLERWIEEQMQTASAAAADGAT